jgi:hypothetical protein
MNVREEYQATIESVLEDIKSSKSFIGEFAGSGAPHARQRYVYDG